MNKCVVIKGIIYQIPEMNIIEEKHIAYHRTPVDGLYKMGISNCGKDDCKIGSPRQSCIEKKCVSKLKCAVYYLDPIIDYVIVRTAIDVADEYELAGHEVMEKLKFDSMMKEMKEKLEEVEEVEVNKGNDIIMINKDELNEIFTSQEITENFKKQLKDNKLEKSGTPMFLEIYDYVIND